MTTANMPHEEGQQEIAELFKLLAIYRTNIALYRKQIAQLSEPYIPPGVVHGIREACPEIRRIKHRLTIYFGIPVADHPDDNADQDYKDQNSGALSLYPEYRNFLRKQIEIFWLQGVLANSLHARAMDQLGVTSTQHTPKPWRMKLQRDMHIDKILPPDVRIVEIFDQLAGRLLIQGGSGAGKTTLMLELVDDLISRAHNDLPIPIVLSLPSWAYEPSRNISTWIANELNRLYKIPIEVCRDLIHSNAIIPFLDDFDKVVDESKKECVIAIQQFLDEHPQRKLVVCSRADHIWVQKLRDEFLGTINIYPLNITQIDNYLSFGKEKLKYLCDAVHQNKHVRELASTSFVLSLMSIVYQGERGKAITSGHENEDMIFCNTVNRFVSLMHDTHSNNSRLYDADQMTKALSLIACHLSNSNKTTFLFDEENLRDIMTPAMQHEHKSTVETATVFFWSMLGLILLWLFSITSGLISVLLIGLGLLTVLGLVSSWKGIQADQMADRVMKNILDKLGIRENYKDTARRVLKSTVRWFIPLISGLAIMAISSIALLWVLKKNDYIPSITDPNGFLESAVKCDLMRKFSKRGYMFTHQLLLEYFASVN